MIEAPKPYQGIGASCLKVLLKHDMLILDLILPDGSGFEIGKKVQ